MGINENVYIEEKHLNFVREGRLQMTSEQYIRFLTSLTLLLSLRLVSESLTLFQIPLTLMLFVSKPLRCEWILGAEVGMQPFSVCVLIDFWNPISTIIISQNSIETHQIFLGILIYKA